MAVGRIVAGIFILSIFAITKISCHGVCELDCSGTKDFDKVVDPFNCTKYFTCLNQKPLEHSTPCPGSQMFDPLILECVDGTDCEPPCGGNTCILTCSADVEGINDPFDCNIFYECGPGGPGPEEHCPIYAPYYNSTSNFCVDDETVCCVPSCKINCVKVPSLIPDPYDCTMYYLCQEEGEPTEDFLFQCAAGEYFDLGRARCSSDAKCQTLCTRKIKAESATAAGGTIVSPVSGGTTGSEGSSIPVTSPAHH